MKKRISLFLAGMLTGIIGTSAVFLAVQKTNAFSSQEKRGITREFFPPLYTQEECRIWIHYADCLIESSQKNTTNEMALAAGLGSFLRKAELHLLVNDKARSLTGRKRAEFIAAHDKWVEEWRKKIKEPPRDPDGNIIEGTMAIPLQAGEPGYLIEKYLKKFPEWADFVHRLRDWEK